MCAISKLKIRVVNLKRDSASGSSSTFSTICCRFLPATRYAARPHFTIALGLRLSEGQESHALVLLQHVAFDDRAEYPRDSLPRDIIHHDPLPTILG